MTDPAHPKREELLTLIANAMADFSRGKEGQLTKIMAAVDQYTAGEKEQAEIRGEIRGKRLALEKMRMGAGEYHDDPYEYVVPLRHIKEYEAELAVFDLDDPNPIFRDRAHLASQEREKEV
jgi:hypothetical protein